VAASVFDAHLCLAEYLLYGQQPYGEVISFASDLRATATESGAARGEAFATCVLGEAELLSGQLGAAEEHLEQATALHEAVGADGGTALSLQRLAELALARNDVEGATTLLDKAERVSRGLTLERHLLGKIYGTRVRATPDPADAMRVVERGEAQMAEVPVCQPCSIGFFAAASIAASRSGDVGVATAYLSRTERVAAAWPGGGWHAAVLECRAALAAAQGDGAAATALLERAVQRFEQAGQPVDAERCRAGHG
jgi:ATP/maltotriose-dependent transcriptional regulator MalT